VVNFGATSFERAWDRAWYVVLTCAVRVNSTMCCGSKFSIHLFLAVEIHLWFLRGKFLVDGRGPLSWHAQAIAVVVVSFYLGLRKRTSAVFALPHWSRVQCRWFLRYDGDISSGKQVGCAHFLSSGSSSQTHICNWHNQAVKKLNFQLVRQVLVFAHIC